MKVENFYKLTIITEQGSYFNENVMVEYYKDQLMTTASMEEFEKMAYHAFETYYDSAEIIVHTDKYVNNVMVTEIKAKDELLERSDRWKIKMEELKMYV